MKLIIHDEKHGTVVDQLELDDLTNDQKILLERVINFLDRANMTSRYKQLVLANDYEIKYDHEYSFSKVEFK